MRQSLFLIAISLLIIQSASAQATLVNINRMNDTSADHRAMDILSKMTLREKIYEMHGHGLLRFGLSALFTNKIKPVIAGGNKLLGIPQTIFFDGPRGVF